MFLPFNHHSLVITAEGDKMAQFPVGTLNWIVVTPTFRIEDRWKSAENKLVKTSWFFPR